MADEETRDPPENEANSKQDLGVVDMVRPEVSRKEGDVLSQPTNPAVVSDTKGDPTSNSQKDEKEGHGHGAPEAVPPPHHYYPPGAPMAPPTYHPPYGYYHRSPPPPPSWPAPPMPPSSEHQVQTPSSAAGAQPTVMGGSPYPSYAPAFSPFGGYNHYYPPMSAGGSPYPVYPGAPPPPHYSYPAGSSASTAAVAGDQNVLTPPHSNPLKKELSSKEESKAKEPEVPLLGVAKDDETAKGRKSAEVEPDKDDAETPADDKEPAEAGNLPLIQTYVKPRRVQGDERRERKNYRSRARANKARKDIAAITAKDESERTPEEQQQLDLYEQQRQKKNTRSRVRAAERNELMAAILAKDDSERTNSEKIFLNAHNARRRRKNEGDRLRRQRLKMLGLIDKGIVKEKGLKITARGPLPPSLAARNPAAGAFVGRVPPVSPPYPSGPPPPGYSPPPMYGAWHRNYDGSMYYEGAVHPPPQAPPAATGDEQKSATV